MFVFILFLIVLAVDETNKTNTIIYDTVYTLSSACRCSQILSKNDCNTFCFWITNNDNTTGYCRDRLCSDYDKYEPQSDIDKCAKITKTDTEKKKCLNQTKIDNCNQDIKNLCYYDSQENKCENLRGTCGDFSLKDQCNATQNCQWNNQVDSNSDESQCQDFSGNCEDFNNQPYYCQNQPKNCIWESDEDEQNPQNGNCTEIEDFPDENQVICYYINQEDVCNESQETNSGYFCAWIANAIPEDVDESTANSTNSTNSTNSSNSSGRLLKEDVTGTCSRFSITKCDDVNNIDADDSIKEMMCLKFPDTCRYTVSSSKGRTVNGTDFITVSYSCQQRQCTDYGTPQLCKDNYKVPDYEGYLHLCNWTVSIDDKTGLQSAQCKEGLIIEEFDSFDEDFCYDESTLHQLTWNQEIKKCTKCPGFSQKFSKTPELSDIEDDKTQQSIQFLYISSNLMLQLWPSIKKSLQNLSKAQNITPFQIQQEIEAIYCLHFENQHIREKINFQNFSRALDNFPLKKEFLQKIPQIAEMALKLETEFPDYIPMVLEEVSFKRRQIAILIINMFFCTTHLQPDHKLLPNTFLMAKLFNRSEDLNVNNKKIQKIRCIIYYIMHIMSNDFKPDEIIRITRKKVKVDFTSVSLCNFIYCEYGQMENISGSYIVDFANKKIGGGVLDQGCVQEEILFLTHPECLATLLITSEIQQEETIIIENVNRLIDYTGYRDKFECKGLLRSIKSVNFICMDATDYSGRFHHQYTDFPRELKKAFCGFKGIKSICTGKWGCGVFGGEWQLKLLIQWVAASLGGCQEVIFINDENYAYNQAFNQLRSLTTSQLWEFVQKYCQLKRNELKMDAIEYILTQI